MRLIKLALLSFVIIFGLITLISFLFPSQIRLSKAVNLPNKRAAIFQLLAADTAWHPAYSDSASAVNMKALQQSVIEQTDSTYIVQIQQGERKPVTSGWQIYGTNAADSLTLQWYMDFKLRWYPWEKFSSLFYEKTYGAMMQQGLDNIKRKLSQ